MSNLNIYYRAFKDYRKNTVNNNVCERDRNALSKSNTELDKLEATKYLCHIEEEWVKTIEEGLEFVEKAVAEERQFIRTQGEVVEIEKVKKISKETVEHLARHSELITRVPKPGATIVPDKLYMVEKLSDYAVYENRFLYMMLCYLRDFINFRLEKIEKLRATYHGNMFVSKEVVTRKRKLVIETKILDDREDNPFPIKDDSSAKILQRIKDCQQIVMALLNTDLMVQVSKSPMIKPPITKTNVLKMNNNFKRSLALYDYVATYKGDGYTFEEVKFDLTPFAEKLADEISESLNLTAFLTYKYGNDIEEYLENEYQKEERARKEEEARRLVEQIQRLKKRALESNKTLEEYMLLLEKRNKMLEKDSEDLKLAKQEIEKLNQIIEELNQEKAELERKIEELEQVIEEKIKEINALNQKYITDMAALRREHEALINKLNKEHQEEINDLKEQFANERQELIDNYESQLDEAYHQLDEMRKAHADAVEDYDNQVLVLNESISDLGSRQKALVKEYEDKLKAQEKKYKEILAKNEYEYNKNIEYLQDENTCILAQYDGLRAQCGYLSPSSDYSSKERHQEWEKEFKAFEKFYKNQWKVTKKEIKKQYLWSEDYVPTDDLLSTRPEDTRNRELIDAMFDLDQENIFLKAQLDGMRAKNGYLTPSTDYASPARFKELEEENEAFKKFFKNQWKITKRELRKKYLDDDYVPTYKEDENLRVVYVRDDGNYDDETPALKTCNINKVIKEEVVVEVEREIIKEVEKEVIKEVTVEVPVEVPVEVEKEVIVEKPVQEVVEQEEQVTFAGFNDEDVAFASSLRKKKDGEGEVMQIKKKIAGYDEELVAFHGLLRKKDNGTDKKFEVTREVQKEQIAGFDEETVAFASSLRKKKDGEGEVMQVKKQIAGFDADKVAFHLSLNKKK